eukprot:jgi/Mesvir1/28695/Mv19668-RA.1
MHSNETSPRKRGEHRRAPTLGDWNDEPAPGDETEESPRSSKAFSFQSTKAEESVNDAKSGARSKKGLSSFMPWGRKRQDKNETPANLDMETQLRSALGSMDLGSTAVQGSRDPSFTFCQPPQRESSPTGWQYRGRNATLQEAEALVNAVQTVDLPVVRSLMDAGVNPNSITAVMAREATCSIMHLACESLLMIPHKDIAKLENILAIQRVLLEAGFDVSRCDTNGENALERAMNLKRGYLLKLHAQGLLATKRLHYTAKLHTLDIFCEELVRSRSGFLRESSNP